MVKIDFNINGFGDALHLPDDHGLTDSEIESMKQARYDKWLDFINNPPAPNNEPVAIDEIVEE